MDPVFLALLAALGTWFVTALGAATVAFFRSPSTRLLNLALGFSAGVMISASFWSLLLPASERAEAAQGAPAYLVVTTGFLAGAVFLWASDCAVSAAAGRAEVGTAAERRRRMGLLVLSITLHNIPEGLAVGVAFGALSDGAGTEAIMGAVSIAVGIGLQNFPEGAAVSLPLRREGVRRGRCFLAGQASGMVEPIASVLGAALVHTALGLLPWALSFAAGAMLLVTVHELIPECQRDRADQPYSATMGIVAGFAVMTLLDVMLG